ncbi:MAG: hypothetical protein K2K83_03680 [Rikenella sp.]|nr:hypothetical protein [Rikenella sp.]
MENQTSQSEMSPEEYNKKIQEQGWVFRHRYISDGENEEAVRLTYVVPNIVAEESYRLKRENPELSRDEAWKQATRNIREQYPGKTTQELIELSRELYRQGKL